MAASDHDCLAKMNIASLDKYKQMQRTLERVNNSIKSITETNRKILFSISFIE